MNHDPPARPAYCGIFFAHNGGTFDEYKFPIVGIIDDEGNPDALAIRSLCPHPFDCGTCPLLRQWIEEKVYQEGFATGWECDTCLEETKAIARILPGYYQAGKDPNLGPDDKEFDPDLPKLTCCTRCGSQSSLLQLVLRKV